MKSMILIILLQFINFVSLTQTIVTGLIFAEVVESVSVTELFKDVFYINDDKKIDVGKIEIKSSFIYDIIISKINIKNTNLSMMTNYSKNNILDNSGFIDIKCESDKTVIKDSYGDINVMLVYN